MPVIGIISKNENPTFSVEKIYLCSSANAIDNTSEQKLDKLGLYQKPVLRPEIQ